MLDEPEPRRASEARKVLATAGDIAVDRHYLVIQREQAIDEVASDEPRAPQHDCPHLPDPPVAILEADDVVQLGRGGFEHVRVQKRDHAVPQSGRDAKGFTGIEGALLLSR